MSFADDVARKFEERKAYRAQLLKKKIESIDELLRKAFHPIGDQLKGTLAV